MSIGSKKNCEASWHWVGVMVLACSGLLILWPASLGAEDSGSGWEAARAPVMTSWGEQVRPANVHPEYPRPQLVRSNWLNLNGLWDYALRPSPLAAAAPPPPVSYDGKILVPFAVESALSGVMKPCDETSVLWYRRTVAIPPEWKGRRVRLLCGGADWQCRALVNGQEVGRHRGGFSRFAFDITPKLKWDGKEEIVLAIVDPTEGDQPRGKQSRAPEGIFYAPTSGIWQTVWLEPVPERCIDDLKLTPDVDAKGLRLRVAVNSLAEDLRVEAVAWAAGKEAGRVTGLANTDLFVPLPEGKLWTPDEPFLHDLEVTLREGDRVVDRVSSYFGLRKVSLLPDPKGVMRIALNNTPLFQIGVLDQGFWPDGLYTPPSEDALKFEINFIRQCGFNLIRKHVKVEPDRWYYWCDRMGLLVWQDMPSGKNATAEGRLAFESELLQILRDLHNHPSVILWVLFNEGWGQYDTERLTRWIKSVDPTRLVSNASGWTDRHVGDLVDLHSYPGPDCPETEARRAAVLGEFGGLGLPIEGHSWSSNRWAYKEMADEKALAAAYEHLLERVWTLHDRRGLSAAVYTQVSDVETECNGLLTYDRKVAKLDPEFVARANHTQLRVPLVRTVIPDASEEPALWKYTFERPAPGWFEPGFGSAGWKEGASGFGKPTTPGARVGTLWDTADIWLRRSFVLEKGEFGGLRLQAHHDENAEIYINGVLAATLSGFTTTYDVFEILPEAAATLKPGTNTLAVHCHQTAGGQYIDVGLVAPRTAPEPGTAGQDRTRRYK